MAARLTAYVVVAIVAATLIAGLIVGAQRDDNDGPVDLIVTNATVYTADRRGTTAEATRSFALAPPARSPVCSSRRPSWSTRMAGWSCRDSTTRTST